MLGRQGANSSVDFNGNKNAKTLRSESAERFCLIGAEMLLAHLGDADAVLGAFELLADGLGIDVAAGHFQ